MRTFVDEQIQDLVIEVGEGETEVVRFAAFQDFRNAKICVKIQKGGVFDGAFADFSHGEGKLNLIVELLGEGAESRWHYAGVSKDGSKKIIDASVEHLHPRTKAEVVQYGVTMKGSRLTFVGTSHIHEGMKGSQTSQKEKIIVFDQDAVGKCSPNLRIDENDVFASHSAVVGRLADEHLFYLLSRGIDRESAKRLLVLGYLRPVLSHYEGELAERIQNKIEEGF